MDYGGHDSVFDNNLILSYPSDGGKCFNIGSFKRGGPSDSLYGNKCVVGLARNGVDTPDDDYSMHRFFDAPGHRSDPRENDGSTIVGKMWESCEETDLHLHANQYYTPDGKARIQCHGDEIYSLSDMQSKFGIELNSTSSPIPEDDVILNWIREMLFNSSHHATSTRTKTNAATAFLHQ